ncbi:MAG: hypothetical protein JW749_07830 [Sedimentisphaerales bacterium]|nr:hypothetical protein [Sedimentisphaerales bacterium]
MKRLILIAVTCCCVFIWSCGGCQKPASENNTQMVSGHQTNKIPSEIAGTWQMRDGVWQMTIEPNGVVSSAVIPLMQCTIRPHQTTHVPMKDGNVSDFTGGDLFAEYDSTVRELSVYIELKNFLIRFFEIRTGGNQLDSFIGPVSEDGLVWKPGWINVFDYGPEFPMDANIIEPAPCVFDKVEVDKPAAEEKAK